MPDFDSAVSSAVPPATADVTLVERVAGGDERALAELYDRYAGLLLALSRRILDDGAEAEEIVQEAFVQAWRQADRYEPRRSSVSTWLVLIARSRAIDRLRTRQVVDRTLATLELETVRHTSPEGVRSVLDGQRRERLRSELARLPPEQRDVLELAFYRGMTQSEIAGETGIPLGTVKTRTLLAMKKLRTALQNEIRSLL